VQGEAGGALPAQAGEFRQALDEICYLGGVLQTGPSNLGNKRIKLSDDYGQFKVFSAVHRQVAGSGRGRLAGGQRGTRQKIKAYIFFNFLINIDNKNSIKRNY
jgi:hypothetical protein